MRNIGIFVNCIVDHETQRRAISIAFPPNQEKLSLKEVTHVLVSAVSLLIKSCKNEDSEIKDYELMSEVIQHLNSEFSSVTSFSDAKTDNSMFKEDGE